MTGRTHRSWRPRWPVSLHVHLFWHRLRLAPAWLIRCRSRRAARIALAALVTVLAGLVTLLVAVTSSPHYQRVSVPAAHGTATICTSSPGAGISSPPGLVPLETAAPAARQAPEPG